MTDFKISLDEDFKKGKLIGTCFNCGKEIDCTGMVMRGDISGLNDKIKLDGQLVIKLEADRIMVQCMRCKTIEDIKRFVRDIHKNSEDFQAIFKNMAELEFAKEFNTEVLKYVNADKMVGAFGAVDAMRDLIDALIRRFRWIEEDNKKNGY